MQRLLTATWNEGTVRAIPLPTLKEAYEDIRRPISSLITMTGEHVPGQTGSPNWPHQLVRQVLNERQLV